MNHVLVVAVKNINIATYLMDDTGYEMKHDDLEFQMLLREIDDPKEKFIVVMFEFGFQKNEIAYMLKVHPSTITRTYTKACRKIVVARFNGK